MGIDLSQGNVCPMCGAQNNGDQSNCWQCKSLLLQNRPRGHVTPAISRNSELHGTSNNTDSVYLWPALGLLILSFGLSVHTILSNLTPPTGVPRGIAEFFLYHMTITRIVLGTSVILISPLLLMLILRLCRIKPPGSARRVALVALIPAALGFVSTWLPPSALPVTPLLPAILSWILLQRGLSLSPARTTVAWCSQMAALSTTVVLGFWVLESAQVGEPLNPLAEIQAIRKGNLDAMPEDLNIIINPGEVDTAFVWQTSGSSWFDRRGNLAQIEFQSLSSEPRVIELIDTTRGETIEQSEVSRATWRSKLFLPAVDASYRVRMRDGFLSDDSLLLHSTLVPQLTTGISTAP